MSTIKTLKIAKNQKGYRVALCWAPEPFKAYSVWAESHNYSRGNIVATWGYVKRGMIYTEAEALFNKRCAGRK